MTVNIRFGVRMISEFKGKPVLATILGATVLAGCVSGAAVVPAPRTQPTPGHGSTGPVTVPIGPPVRTSTPPPQIPADPGFQRAPAGLDDRLFQIWRAFPGKTGIAVQRIDGEWTLTQRGNELFPQQSVSKLWVVMAVLDAVDNGRLRMDQNVRIGPEDLTLFHQPIAARVQSQGSVTMTVRELIETAITQSDNTANDSLLRTVGGPDAVRRFIAKHNLGAIRFGPGERLLQSGAAGLKWQQSYSIGRSFQTARAALPDATRKVAMDAYRADPPDGASPAAIASALARLARGTLLSPESTQYLLGVMTRTKSGPQRLKAGLPAGWRFLHKTGTGQDYRGMTIGYNDIGIATAPDGTRYAIVVLMAEASSPIPTRMATMQSVSRAVAEFHGR